MHFEYQLKRFVFVAMLVIGFVLAGCELSPQRQQVETPTESLVVISTFTPTATEYIEPSPTPAPTQTATVTRTPTITLTPTEAPIGSFAPFEAFQEQSLGVIYDLTVSPEGVLWLITDMGLISYTAGDWTTHPGHGDIVLGFDDFGRTWVTTKESETISAWDGADWQIYGLETGWSPAGPIWRSGPYASVSEHLITDERGRVWLATNRDVRRFEGKVWRIYDPDDVGYYPSEEMLEDGFSYSLTDMAIDSAGDVWIADCAWMGPGPVGQGARWYTGRYWWGRSSQVVSSGCVEDIEVDEDGNIWIGVDETLWRYSPWRGWRRFDPPEIDPSWGARWGFITEIILGGDGTVWVTLSPCGGASCDTGKFYLYRVQEGEWTLVSEEGPGDLALSASGEGWLCAGNSIYRVTTERVELAVDLSPFYCIIEMDSSSRTWMAQPGQSQLWMADTLDGDE